jgi:excinuclease ABC subunit B
VKARISDILDSVYERDHVRADISGASGKGFADGGHLVGNNLQAHLNALEKDMRNAAADLDFEKAARLRDEIKRLKAAELAVMDDPIARDEARSLEGGSAKGNIKGGTSARREPLLPGGEKVPGRADEGGEERSAQRGNRSGESIAATNARSESEGPGGGASSASYFAKPSLDDMGPGTDTAIPARGPLFRRNTLDEMTVGRTEKPVTGALPAKPSRDPNRRFSPLLEGQPERDTSPSSSGSTSPSSSGSTRGSTDDPRPLVRGKVGAGSYEDPGEVKRKGRTKGKTGRPGR